MRRLRSRSAALAGLLASAAMAAATLGCLPTRGDISPDGRMFYFHMVVQGPEQTDIRSVIVALDADTGRLAALTDGAGASFWCALAPDAKSLAVMGPGPGAVSLVDCKRGESFPLAGTIDNYMCPRLILGNGSRPADRLGLLVQTQVQEYSEEPSRYVVLTFGGPVPVPDLAAWGACRGEPAVLPGGVLALGVYRVTEGAKAGYGQPKKYEAAVIRLDVNAQLKASFTPEPTKQEAAKAAAAKPAAPPGPPKAEVLARWASESPFPPPVSLAITGDGSKTQRLVAAVPRLEQRKSITAFVEILTPEKGEPRTQLLFEDTMAGGPQWTPDGQAIVYVRANATNQDWTDVVLWRPDQKEPLVLAHLPGRMSEQEPAITAWRWLANGRLRIFNVAKDGLRQVEAAADGTGAKARLLKPDRMKLQLYLALAERAKGGAEPAQWLLAGAAKADKDLQPTMKEIAAAAKAVEDARAKLWAMADAWEVVPAMAEVPAPKPEPPPGREVPEGPEGPDDEGD